MKIPVYEIKMEQGSKKTKVVHRNLVLSLPCTPEDATEVLVIKAKVSVNTSQVSR